ncbi:MAG: hypothetical protein A2622_09115 [Bdellovibrionales bacterium RIFCSPHIGHO2_01_FULL_40_29]|nr:MAG: hypothetical protein A2622_09115 [Bdellovibrionales bacterium RIFCSPHIGHO2_01_FULL_40_29]OFZ32891.1 MAG: hypothetical protein A3D17_09325 [Bdellovibrionales bacterium RIFCSPHIGHO2_02_FULL_40_15]
MKALLIDHDDSFTHNLRHWLSAFTDHVEIINHRAVHNQDFSNYSFIVLSPGPKSPRDYPHMIEWLQKQNPAQPLFGVCLGMQLMAISEGAEVIPYSPPLHGKKSKLKSDILPFDNIGVARYHSLCCAHLNEFITLATSDQIPMWIQHKSKKWMAVQFHPESFLTEQTFEFQNYLKKWISP